jgi:spore maturation protein CgeB
VRVVYFTHSLRSDWNHGNAHFLRGILTELILRGHQVRVYEPKNAWSVQHLVKDHGKKPLKEFEAAYPLLKSTRYVYEKLDLDEATDGANLVIVHEWNERALVRKVGQHRRKTRRYRLLFHDTHHRIVTLPWEMAAYDLTDYDGVLAFGEVIRRRYLEGGWTGRAWTWHEAADTRVFRPILGEKPEGDLIWIGNWGDEERTAELYEFLLQPTRALKLKTRMHGVRYPEYAVQMLKEAGIDYAGWAPNFRAPRIFARFKATVHVPRRPYVEKLPGIPTIRPFEALACGIPLVSAPWKDAEGLFQPGRDFLVAKNGREMQKHLRALLNDPSMRATLAQNGRETILARHTCAHRVDELMAVYQELQSGAATPGSGNGRLGGGTSLTARPEGTRQRAQRPAERDGGANAGRPRA